MRNRDRWHPSKYVYRNGRLAASRDPKEVGVGSRLLVDLIAECYDANLRQHARGRLLDLGCGKVPLFLAYKDYVTETICVDWENTLHQNEYVDSECDLTGALPFEDGEFDTILLSDVLEHVPEPEHLWREMSRLLSIGGRVIMNVPFYYWLHEQPHDYYRYTEFALRRFVERAGLRLLQLDSIGGAPEIMTDIFAKNVLRAPRIGRSLAVFAQWLTLSVIRTKIGRKISEATRDGFPFAYFLVAEKLE
jgi:SAM-dependent methyltransferase